MGTYSIDFNCFYRTRDQLPMKVPQKGKRAEKFEFEPWPQASKVSSWKVSFRREGATRSTHLRLVSESLIWHLVKEELTYAGFIFDKHQLEFEALDSKIVKRITMMIPADFKRETNFLEEAQYKNKRPMLTGGQITFSSISVRQHP